MYRNIVFISTLTIFVLNVPLFAQEKEDYALPCFFDLSIEQLMQVPVITAPSRLPWESSGISIPVSLITVEDIRFSGLTNIPKILRLYRGISDEFLTYLKRFLYDSL